MKVTTQLQARRGKLCLPSRSNKSTSTKKNKKDQNEFGGSTRSIKCYERWLSSRNSIQNFAHNEDYWCGSKVWLWLDFTIRMSLVQYGVNLINTVSISITLEIQASPNIEICEEFRCFLTEEFFVTTWTFDYTFQDKMMKWS